MFDVKGKCCDALKAVQLFHLRVEPLRAQGRTGDWLTPRMWSGCGDRRVRKINPQSVYVNWNLAAADVPHHSVTSPVSCRPHRKHLRTQGVLLHLITRPNELQHWLLLSFTFVNRLQGRGGGAYSSTLWKRGGAHPGQVANSSQGQIERKTTSQTRSCLRSI